MQCLMNVFFNYFVWDGNFGWGIINVVQVV